MAINWGKVLDVAVDITTAVGAAAMQIAVIDNAVDRCRRLSANDIVVSFAREVTQMDTEVWGAWRFRLALLANQNNDQTAKFMLQIGDFSRAEMRRIIQLIQYPINEAVELTIEHMHDQSEYDRLCFFATLATLGQANLKAEMVIKRLVRMLES